MSNQHKTPEELAALLAASDWKPGQRRLHHWSRCHATPWLRPISKLPNGPSQRERQCHQPHVCPQGKELARPPLAASSEGKDQPHLARVNS